MRELPILFSTEMVRAILDGRKTMTRRVIKNHDIISRFDIDIDGSIVAYIDQETGDCFSPEKLCPYQPGDKLWVRETWCDEWKDPDGFTGNYLYRADGIEVYHVDGAGKSPWRPSIHMPKEAARIWLEVTNVMAERLQEISEDDARAEGCITYHDKIGDGKFDDVIEFDLTARDAFTELWNNTIKKKDIDTYGWDANPWVWVISFKRIGGTP